MRLWIRIKIISSRPGSKLQRPLGLLNQVERVDLPLTGTPSSVERKCGFSAKTSLLNTLKKL